MDFRDAIRRVHTAPQNGSSIVGVSLVDTPRVFQMDFRDAIHRVHTAHPERVIHGYPLPPV